MQLNILPSIPALFMPIRVPCLHVKSYPFPYQRRWIGHALCLLGPSLLWLSETKNGLYMFVYLRLHIIMLTMLPSVRRNPTVLHLPFSPLLYIENLIVQIDDSLKVSLGLYPISMMVFLWTLNFFQGSIPASIFCCTEQGDSLTLLEDGVSTFHCGSCPGQEHSFWLFGSLW